jgi:hypothetical protein
MDNDFNEIKDLEGGNKCIEKAGRSIIWNTQ